jgi:hypothetical protein
MGVEVCPRQLGNAHRQVFCIYVHLARARSAPIPTRAELLQFNRSTRPDAAQLMRSAALLPFTARRSVRRFPPARRLPAPPHPDAD